LWPNSAELVENALGANVTEVPDFICAFDDFFHPFWQTIVRVREHKNLSDVSSCCLRVRHISLNPILFARQNQGAYRRVQLLTKRASTATLD
jgi:hypothetical protein